MTSHCDNNTISQILGIPIEIIEGLLSGRISEDVLEQYNPAKPPELKLVKEDGVKIIEQKLDQLTQTKKPKKKTKSLWNFTLDIIWLVALFVSLSASAWVVYYVGQQVGFEHPWLTYYATYIEEFVKGLK